MGTLDIWAHEFLDRWAHWMTGHTDKWAHWMTGHMTLIFKYPPPPHCVRETVRDISREMPPPLPDRISSSHPSVTKGEGVNGEVGGWRGLIILT